MSSSSPYICLCSQYSRNGKKLNKYNNMTFAFEFDHTIKNRAFEIASQSKLAHIYSYPHTEHQTREYLWEGIIFFPIRLKSDPLIYSIYNDGNRYIVEKYAVLLCIWLNYISFVLFCFPQALTVTQSQNRTQNYGERVCVCFSRRIVIFF